MSRVIIISPHLDDAVLSCWHQLQQPDRHVLTVFAGVPARDIGSIRDIMAGFWGAIEAMTKRMKENEEALASTPSVGRYLSFLDRIYDKTPRNIGVIADAIEELYPWEEHFIVPIGLGSYLRKHADHITIREVGLELLRRNREVKFYADIPYMLPIVNFRSWPSRISIGWIRRKLGRVVEMQVVSLKDEEIIKKMAAVRTYSSQFPKINVLTFGALARKSAYRWEVIFIPSEQ